jgi:DNA-binding transcriptional LysR family regulator
MNIHHLELFYYVARHRGVSAAARRIPYGIQQPAISAQIIQLEDSLGTTLFHRRPFQLTPAGVELFNFVEPFFAGVEDAARRVRGDGTVRMRIGAPETVQRDYLPRLLKGMRASVPELAFTLFTGRLAQIEAKLLTQEIDIGIAPLEGARPEGIRQKVMIQLAMVLLVAEGSPIKSATALWRRDRISEPLITLPSDEPTCRQFQRQLQKRKIEWFPSMELNSQELVARYAAEGFGIGLILQPPEAPPPVGTRILELAGFPKVPYGVVWLGTLTPVQKLVMEEAAKISTSLSQARST